MPLNNKSGDIMGRYEQKIKDKKYNKEWKVKRISVFFLIFLFFAGVFAVDYEYSNMMGFEKEMVLGCKRLDSEMIKIYLLGYEVEMNSKEVVQDIEETVSILMKKTKVSIYKIRRKMEELIKDNEPSPKGIKKI